MDLEEACAYAVLDLTGEAVPVGSELSAASGLTPRELEVVELLGQGWTNREIARQLVISERTAANHVEHILNKLGFHTRSQAAAWSVEQRLLR